MSHKYSLVVIGTICGVSLTLSVWVHFSTTRIGYVRSNDLVSHFKGTIDARQKFETKRKQMLSNIDSLESLYKHSREDYLKFKDQMKSLDRANQEKNIQAQGDHLVQYRSAIETRIGEEDSKMMEGVLNQVNSFIEEYAKANNYDLILGTTLSGSLLYAKSGMDITDVLLVELNSKYSGK